jgi:hypothetical protein
VGIAATTTLSDSTAAIEEHWGASEAGDTEVEHVIYAIDAILDYPPIVKSPCTPTCAMLRPISR